LLQSTPTLFIKGWVSSFNYNMKFMTLDKSEKTISLQSFNSLLTGLVILLCGYIITDLNSIKTTQNAQGLDIVRIDTNQKGVMEKLKIMEINQTTIQTNQQNIISDVAYLKAVTVKLK